MLIFRRSIENQIRRQLTSPGMIVILGPRQSGKTTLAKTILGSIGADEAYFNCEHADVRKTFVEGDPRPLRDLIGAKEVVVFDEVQTITNIGSILKLFHDTYPNVKVIATGSSAFDIANKVREPLTGRAIEYMLYPLSLEEIRSARDVSHEDLVELLITGSYPAVVAAQHREDKLQILKNIATNYLYKDVFTFEAIRNPKAFEDLLTHLASRIGSTISAYDLARELGISAMTVEHYMRLLEQSFVIKRIYSFARNYSNELKKSYKIYFIDNGVRNALTGTLDGFSSTDMGVLFESFFATELFKGDTLVPFPPKTHFWRTRLKHEIDFVRTVGTNQIDAYECKWNSSAHTSFTVFQKHYPDAHVHIITPEIVHTLTSPLSNG